MHVRTMKDLERLIGNPADERSDDGGNDDMTTRNEETGKSAAEVVAIRAKKLCFSRGQNPNDFKQLNAATIEVLQADKKLGESYKRLDETFDGAA